MLKETNDIDKERIIEILTYAFESNQSVNYIVKQDECRIDRVRLLMEYAIRVCSAFGQVVLSDDKAGLLNQCVNKVANK